MKEEFTIRNAETDDVPNIALFLRRMMIDEMYASGGYPVSKNDTDWEKYSEIIKNVCGKEISKERDWQGTSRSSNQMGAGE
jgi:hypothetical protein